jgi:fatty acid desaturase
MSVFDLWMYYVLFWLLPAGVTASIFRLRMMAEHFGVPNDSEIRGTRSVSAGLIERMIIAPLNVGYHLEHHMFPSVPWFNQRKLRQLLLNEADYASKAHMTQSYLGFKNSVLSELTQNGKA